MRWEDVDLATGVIQVRRGWDPKEGEIEPKSRTFDLYGHLFPGSEAQAADLLDDYLARAAGGSTGAQTGAHPAGVA
jgi:hypothetical protein